MIKFINWLCLPKNIKLIVNIFIILVGAMSGIIGFTPNSMMSLEIKVWLLNIFGVLAGMFKGIEKLFINNENEWKNTKK